MGEQWCYEPKYDGFRAIVFVDREETVLQSRGGKPLGRYFPELIFPTGRYVIDGYAARDIGEISGGAIVVALLALAVEGGFALVQRSVGPGGAPRARIARPVVQPEEANA